MINVVCLKFGNKYGPEYVNRLFYAVRRNLTLPFKFHCFTENTHNIHPSVITHPLQLHRHIEGWWHKLYMFKRDCPIEGRILFIDLDTLVTGNIDAIASHDTGFVVLHDFYKSRKPGGRDRWGSGQEAVGSGLMAWESGKHPQIWDTFIANPEKAVLSLKPHGDQKWIQQNQKQRVYWQDLFPDQVVSFKMHCNNRLPKKARIVCYHGKPSIPESINSTTQIQGYKITPTAWVKKHWFDDKDSPTTKTRETPAPKETNRLSAPKPTRGETPSPATESSRRAEETRRLTAQKTEKAIAKRRQRRKLRLEARRKRSQGS